MRNIIYKDIMDSISLNQSKEVIPLDIMYNINQMVQLSPNERHDSLELVNNDNLEGHQPISNE